MKGYIKNKIVSVKIIGTDHRLKKALCVKMYLVMLLIIVVAESSMGPIICRPDSNFWIVIAIKLSMIGLEYQVTW